MDTYVEFEQIKVGVAIAANLLVNRQINDSRKGDIFTFQDGANKCLYNCSVCSCLFKINYVFVKFV